MFCFVKKNVFYSLIYNINFIQIAVTNKEVFELSQPSKCKNDEYFDTVSFSCVQCDANKNLQLSADRLRCICNRFSKKIGFKDGYPVCIPCGNNAIVTIDGNDCVPCNTTCKCATNEIQIDRNSSGTLLDAMYCLPCPDNTYLFLDGSKCLPCKNLDYNYHKNNVYLTNYHYAQIQDHCLHKSIFLNKENLKTAFQVKFENQNIDSYYFRNELQIATYFCKKKDKLACQHLSNMCALSLYTNDMACMLFMQGQKLHIWLFYNKNETTALLNSKQITQEYSLMKYNNKSIVNFTIATFSLHGNLKSVGTPNIPCNLLENVRFGINFEKKCKLAVKDLIQAEVEFMSPYLTFRKNDKILTHALPILIKNINQNTNEISNWQLVRKFFFVDNISGFKISNFTTSKARKVDELSILRYIKTLNIIINIQNTKDKDKIFPPVLIVEYAELTHEQISKIAEVTLHYRIKFTIKDNNINSNVKVTIGIFLGLALIFSGIKTWNYSKQHYTSTFNIFVLIWFFIYIISSIGNIILLCVISLCLYLFIFYEGQTIPYILLLEDINEKTIKIFTIITFCFKFIEVLGFMCQYWNIDIIFIDWEQPKKMYNQSIRNKYDPLYTSINELHVDKLLTNRYKHSETSSEIITAKRKKILYKLNKYNNSDCFDKSSAPSKYKANIPTVQSISKISSKIINENRDFTNSSVSIWRTYFIANQWLNLQTRRKINVTVQLLCVLCIFQIIQIHPWILRISDVPSKFSEGNYNFTLYYTVCILIYMSIYCIQWLVSVLFFEPCITNRMQEFVNLCSTANISVFILPFNYYGFYIHGRSVHGFADVNLPTLINDLQMEQNNLCAHKGLVPGTTQQTFILRLTKTFRIIFDTGSGLTKIKRSNFLKTYSSSVINGEHIFNTQLKLKQLLCKFVDHCIKHEDYIIKEQHFFEKLFNIIFSSNEEKSIFYIDNNYTFNQVLLYGNEWLLATFEISIFTFIIVLCEDCILAITLTALTSMFLSIIVKYNCKKNLSNNTLLDKTFLI